MPDYRISDDALLDIGDIFVFGAEQFGRGQAEKYLASMQSGQQFNGDGAMATAHISSSIAPRKPEFSFSGLSTRHD